MWVLSTIQSTAYSLKSKIVEVLWVQDPYDDDDDDSILAMIV